MHVFGCIYSITSYAKIILELSLVEVVISSPELLNLVLVLLFLEGGQALFSCMEGLPPFCREGSGTPVFKILNEPGCQLACTYHVSLPILANSLMSAQTSLIVFWPDNKAGSFDSTIERLLSLSCAHMPCYTFC